MKDCHSLALSSNWDGLLNVRVKHRSWPSIDILQRCPVARSNSRRNQWTKERRYSKCGLCTIVCSFQWVENFFRYHFRSCYNAQYSKSDTMCSGCVRVERRDNERSRLWHSRAVAWNGASYQVGLSFSECALFMSYSSWSLNVKCSRDFLIFELHCSQDQ